MAVLGSLIQDNDYTSTSYPCRCHFQYWVNFGESGGICLAGCYVLDLMSWEVFFDSLSDRITIMLGIKYKSCISHISGVPSLNFCDRICAHPLLVNLGGPIEKVGTFLIWWGEMYSLTVCQIGLLPCFTSNIRLVPLILVEYHPWTFVTFFGNPIQK